MKKWDGLNKAIIGIGSRCGFEDVLVYDYEKMIEIFMDNENWTMEESIDYISFNIEGAYIGKDTPIILHNNVEDIEEKLK